MKTALLFLSLAVVAFGQTATTVTPPVTATPTVTTPISQTVTSAAALATTTVNTSALPGITLGVGPAWNRGNTNAVAVDTTLAIRLSATSNVYSWTDITTPVVSPKATTTGGPVLSTVTTGAAWVVAQNTTGSVSLILIGQAGFSTSTVGTSPAFTGSVAAAFKLGKSNVYALPYFKAGSPTLGTSGTVAAFVMQPGVQLMYGWGK